MHSRAGGLQEWQDSSGSPSLLCREGAGGSLGPPFCASSPPTKMAAPVAPPGLGPHHTENKTWGAVRVLSGLGETVLAGAVNANTKTLDTQIETMCFGLPPDLSSCSGHTCKAVT